MNIALGDLIVNKKSDYCKMNFSKLYSCIKQAYSYLLKHIYLFLVLDLGPKTNPRFNPTAVKL